MADGRCFTLNSSAQLTNNYIMNQNGIALKDNYSYRQLLQKQGPELLNKIQEQSCPSFFKYSVTISLLTTPLFSYNW